MLTSDVHEEGTELVMGDVVAVAASTETGSALDVCCSCGWPNPGSDPGRPDGPTSYEAMHLWADYLLEAISNSDPGKGLDLLRRNLGRKVILTTHYSGMGTAEIAAGMLEDAAMGGSRKLMGGSSQTSAICTYAASDIATFPQKVLVSHRGPWAPRHVFGDTCFPVPVGIRGKWLRMLSALRTKIDADCEAQRRPMAPTRNEAIAKGGALFVETVMDDLEKVSFARDFKQYCLKCERFCARFPPPRRPSVIVSCLTSAARHVWASRWPAGAGSGSMIPRCRS